MRKILALCLIASLPVFAFPGDIYDEIAAAIRTGNAKEVSNYFSSNIDMTILTQESMYSKAQAEIVLKDFFAKNPPKSFVLIHKGTSKEGSMYAIGNMESSSGSTFRTYFFIKQVSGKNLIQELRFEKE